MASVQMLAITSLGLRTLGRAAKPGALQQPASHLVPIRSFILPASHIQSPSTFLNHQSVLHNKFIQENRAVFVSTNGLSLHTTSSAQQTSSASLASAGSNASTHGVRKIMKEYGPIAVGLYVSLSSIIFLGCFISISFLGIDEAKLTQALDRAKEAVGFTPPSRTEKAERALHDQEVHMEIEESVQGLRRYISNPTALVWATNGLLALAMGSVFVPAKVGLTAALSPIVARKLRSMGFEFGKRKIMKK